MHRMSNLKEDDRLLDDLIISSTYIHTIGNNNAESFSSQLQLSNRLGINKHYVSTVRPPPPSIHECLLMPLIVVPLPDPLLHK